MSDGEDVEFSCRYKIVKKTLSSGRVVDMRGVYIQDGKWWTQAGERQLLLADVLYLVKAGRIERIFFLAGTDAQMQHYVRKLEVDPGKAVYLGDPRRLRGLHQPTVVICGTAYERRDYYDILGWLRERVAAVYWHGRPDWG